MQNLFECPKFFKTWLKNFSALKREPYALHSF